MKKKIVSSMILITIILLITIYILYSLNYLPHKKYSNEDFNIAPYISSVDKDEDGIDDQTDILKSVRKYISTKPKYKSEYYANGYPDNGYGVCTDVVAFGLLGAGYDIKELLNEDVKIHRESYDISVVDKNIDFRRVLNLKAYLDNNAISLTTDISNISEWQGGDIVAFSKHIGVVSDKRNKNGVPFVIHHRSPLQIFYEEDILEKRNDIIGHYRIS